MDYPKIEPAASPAFQEAMHICGGEMLRLHLAADAIQDAAFRTARKTGTDRHEISMGALERALDMGSEAAILCAKIAGFTQMDDGRWYSSCKGEAELLEIGPNFFTEYAHAFAETFRPEPLN